MIDVDASLAALSLRERCLLVVGQTNWRTQAFPEAGVPQLKMSDGPAGLRGEGHGSSGTPGVSTPSGITLGSSWDPDLLREIGDLLGTEARRKRAHVLLGPTVNLHRTPIGGRTFECYSEDPELTARLAERYVQGVQSHEVAVTVKHFVCNDTEIERLSVNVEVDERTLRETYLRPFERAVMRGGAWGVMSAYNRLDGDFCAENRRLLTDILRHEWGFDGYVVSDWFGVHEPVGAATAGLSLEMPAPVRVYGDRLLAAVEAGHVTEDAVESIARDVLTVIARTRADERSCDEPEESVDDPAERALTRRAAVAGTVLLRNEPVGSESAGTPALPLDVGSLSSIAVIGPNATIDRSMGGGSASLTPLGHRTLLDALRDRLAPEGAGEGGAEGADAIGGVSIVAEPGVRIDRLTPLVRRPQLRTPSDEPGLLVEYVDGVDWGGETVASVVNGSTMVRFFGTTPDEVDATAFSARIRGSFLPEVDGPHEFGVVSTGPVRAVVHSGGVATTVVDDPEMLIPRTREFFGYGSEETVVSVECRAGEPVALDLRWATGQTTGFAALRVGVRAPDPVDLFERAVRAAADADVALVVVGTNDEWETEGFDRAFIELPGRQDELVEAVAAVNDRTVVVVNAGSPVAIDWVDRERAPAAIVTSFFAGQEQAEAMVDVLIGDADPGGRLPVTYPRRLADTPAFLHHTPDHDSRGRGTQRYAEGLFTGHRWYEARSIEPRFWFGHGLTYGATVWGDATVDRVAAAEVVADSDPFVVTVPVSSVGERTAVEVVQGYVAAVDPVATRPPRVLATWSKLTLEPGAEATVELEFGFDALRRWDTSTSSWIVDPGVYELVVARSSDPVAEHCRIRITVG
ncbi:MAG: glycoside hydrolase family 3 C-terminal domain-containing protein [Actinomycetota bacterium]